MYKMLTGLVIALFTALIMPMSVQACEEGDGHDHSRDAVIFAEGFDFFNVAIPNSLAAPIQEEFSIQLEALIESGLAGEELEAAVIEILKGLVANAGASEQIMLYGFIEPYQNCGSPFFSTCNWGDPIVTSSELWCYCGIPGIIGMGITQCVTFEFAERYCSRLGCNLMQFGSRTVFAHWTRP